MSTMKKHFYLKKDTFPALERIEIYKVSLAKTKHNSTKKLLSKKHYDIMQITKRRNIKQARKIII